MQRNQESLLEAYGLTPKGPVATTDLANFDMEDKRDALSDHDHYTTAVKRKNFITLFLEEYMVDKFVAGHLYGAGGVAINGDMSVDDLSNLEDSLMNLSTSFARNTKRTQKI
jgi:hypothetical protein